MTRSAILTALESIEPGVSWKESGPRFTSSKSGKSYYCKSGGTYDYEQWKGEAESLIAMYQAAPGLCPRLLHFGESGAGSRKPVFVSEYANFSSLSTSSAETLAKRMALELHGPERSQEGCKGRFGFEVPTYCGATRLENGWHASWNEAYARLIASLLERIRAKGSQYRELCDLGEGVVSKVIPRLLDPVRLKVEPVILHGDLWSGNVGTLSSGDPIIFDPASYYGHNEADLAIARMFGGFPPSFYSTYHRYRPKSEPVEEYEERVALYELFHYLNHTLLFGGSYASPSMSRVRRLLRYVEGREDS